MDHPNIARVLDAGATKSGRPYFVMELVRGMSITKYCDQAKLSTNERLALFIEVCGAVQHAHQKGIIHRDIKPANVLLDNYSNAYLADFGIANGRFMTILSLKYWGVKNIKKKVSVHGACVNTIRSRRRSACRC